MEQILEMLKLSLHSPMLTLPSCNDDVSESPRFSPFMVQGAGGESQTFSLFTCPY